MACVTVNQVGMVRVRAPDSPLLRTVIITA